MTIAFYTQGENAEWFWLSNFAPHGFLLGGVYWPTVEHYFQAMKFAGTPQAEKIRLAKNPKQAKELGRTREIPLRADWETAKDEVMRGALAAKFNANPGLRARLLATGEEELVENSPSDFYWGCGNTGTGKNRLGQLLMELRASLKPLL